MSGLSFLIIAVSLLTSLAIYLLTHGRLLLIGLPLMIGLPVAGLLSRRR